MKVEVLSKRADRLKVKPESEEDLWTLKRVLRPGDYVRAKTVRDVAVKGASRKEKRPIVVKVRVKDVSFQSFTGRLRIFGVIVEGPERYGVKGKHQAITVQPGMEIEIEREGGWSPRDIERLKSSGPKGRAVIAAVDYDEYAIAVLSHYGYKLVDEGSLHLPGKDDPNRDQILQRHIAEIARRIVDAAKQYNADLVVIAGPGPLKLDVSEKVKNLSMHLRVLTDNVSMGGRSGIEELVRRPTMESILKDFTVVQAEQVLNEIMVTAARSPELVVFGLREVRRAAELGAIEKLLILDSLIYSFEEEESAAAEEAIELAEQYRGEVYIVPEDSPVGEKLLPLGGAVAKLRYPVKVGGAE